MNVLELKKKSIERRLDIVEMIYRAQTGHIGGSLSSVDMLTALYYNILNLDPSKRLDEQPDRDRFILSKGHCVEGYYAVLADVGFFSKKELMTFSSFGSQLIGHPSTKVSGVEFNTGALGHGLSLGVGVALAGKKSNRSYRTYILMGDGELGEGSIYEAAMSASHYRLDNLIAIIDRNGLQISGPTEDVMSLEPLSARWSGFGFDVLETNGHDMVEILSSLEKVKQANGKPKLIISHTTKGKGVSFMENQKGWHHGVLNEEQYQTAMADLRVWLKEVQ